MIAEHCGSFDSEPSRYRWSFPRLLVTAVLVAVGCGSIKPKEATSRLHGESSLISLPVGSWKALAQASGLLLMVDEAQVRLVSQKVPLEEIWLRQVLDSVSLPTALVVSGAAMGPANALVASQWQAPNADGEVAALQFYQVKDGSSAKRIGIAGTGNVRFHDIVRFSDGFIVAGEFTDTMRIGNVMMSSAGGTDGFFARITDTGVVAWAHRFGGNDNDSAARLDAASDERFVLAGSFTNQADWRGRKLTAIDPRSLVASGVVAVLDPDGNVKALDVFSSPRPIAIADVAINSHGEVAIALTARQQVQWTNKLANISGAADAVLAWYGADLTLAQVTTMGGPDYDGASALAALPSNQWLVAGWCSGSCTIAGKTVTASDGTAAFVATIDASHSATDASVIASTAHEWAGPLQVDAAGWSLLMQGGKDMTVDGQRAGANALLRFSFTR
jgi:hypothetical protein